jgi:hypothetical protein
MNARRMRAPPGSKQLHRLRARFFRYTQLCDTVVYASFCIGLPNPGARHNPLRDTSAIDSPVRAISRATDQ